MRFKQFEREVRHCGVHRMLTLEAIKEFNTPVRLDFRMLMQAQRRQHCSYFVGASQALYQQSVILMNLETSARGAQRERSATFRLTDRDTPKPNCQRPAGHAEISKMISQEESQRVLGVGQ